MGTDEELKPTATERWRLARDVLLFLLGAAGFVHELVSGRGLAERPVILGLCAVMMGLGKVLEVASSLRGGDRP